MIDMKFKEMTEMIEAELIKEMGIAYFNLCRNKRVSLMCDKFHEIMNEMKERQD